MTKKDLFDGLNYIDDQIIEEAQPTGESAGYSDEIYVKNHETHHGGKENKNRKKHKKFARAAKALATVAAVLVVAVLGTEVVRLNNRIDELETKTANVISPLPHHSHQRPLSSRWLLNTLYLLPTPVYL